ncbi:Tetratricopeptide repeat protein [Sulfidibacter corallicola]|uniref:Tetratricopeptide repeat protein n=1 Tax=Sulfidibacter corallicola TaxID=2818388 RepID=A0A8A4TUC8_SULCO|nr:tetratricopeptide repeat protein [Sulfidibacter corallicola]QTD50135.1 tetratricopeptide repeat protein [Sulfidibacter corallicola]
MKISLRHAMFFCTLISGLTAFAHLDPYVHIPLDDNGQSTIIFPETTGRLPALTFEIGTGSTDSGFDVGGQHFEFHTNDAGRLLHSVNPHELDALSFGGSAYTLSVWFKTSGQFAHDRFLVSRTAPLNANLGWFLMMRDGQLVFQRRDNGESLASIDDPSDPLFVDLDDDQWHHVAVVRDLDRPDDLVMYIDGVAQVSRDFFDMNETDYLLEGELATIGESLDISVRLLKLPSRELAWSQIYRQNLTDLTDIQSKIAVDISRALALTLVPEDRFALARAATTDADAFKAYLRGHHLLDQGVDSETRDAAEVAFRQAIDLDPGFVPAYAGLSELLLYGVSQGQVGFAKVAAEAREWVDKGMAIDPSQPEILGQHAVLLWLLDQKETEARALFEQVLTLQPNYVRLRGLYAMLLTDKGETSYALQLVEDALRIDPDCAQVLAAAGYIHCMSVDWESCLRVARRLAKRVPRNPLPYFFQALGFRRAGRWDEAREAMDTALTHSDRSPSYLIYQIHFLAEDGALQEAERLLEELKAKTKGKDLDPNMLEKIRSFLDQKLSQEVE